MARCISFDVPALRVVTAAATLVALLVLGACGDDPPEGGAVDAGPPSRAMDAGMEPDAGPPPPPSGSCTCEATEDCRGCFEHIGRCCYEDTTWFGTIDLIVANCEGNPACNTCCNECLAKSCEELLASNDCPAQ